MVVKVKEQFYHTVRSTCLLCGDVVEISKTSKRRLKCNNYNSLDEIALVPNACQKCIPHVSNPGQLDWLMNVISTIHENQNKKTEELRNDIDRLEDRIIDRIRSV